MPSNYLILCCPLLLLPLIFPSIRIFSNESALPMRWPKYWSFSFGISPSSEHPGLISFRMDWLDLPAAQGTLKSLLQHHSSKSSILQLSAFFIVQLSHSYMTTRKTIASIRRTFVDKVMSLLFGSHKKDKMLNSYLTNTTCSWYMCHGSSLKYRACQFFCFRTLCGCGCYNIHSLWCSQLFTTPT